MTIVGLLRYESIIDADHIIFVFFFFFIKECIHFVSYVIMYKVLSCDGGKQFYRFLGLIINIELFAQFLFLLNFVILYIIFQESYYFLLIL